MARFVSHGGRRQESKRFCGDSRGRLGKHSIRKAPRFGPFDGRPHGYKRQGEALRDRLGKHWLRKTPRFDSRGVRQEESIQSWMKCSERHSQLRSETAESGLYARVNSNWHDAAVRKDFSRLDEVRALTGVLTEANYTRTLGTLLKVEEAHDAINQRRFDMFDQYLTIDYYLDMKGRPTENVNFYGITVEGLSNGQPNLIAKDHVILRRREGVSRFYCLMSVASIKGDFVLLPNVISDKTFLTGRLDIFFFSAGLYSYYERALKKFEEDLTVRSRIFEVGTSVFSGLEHHVEQIVTTPTMDCDNLPEAEERLEKLNEHQKQAILSILEASCWPKPYILFGPPGTGKTHTLAEAIGQIYVRKPRSRILYCANSNTCVDQMVEKLKKISLISSHDIKRLFAGQTTEGLGMSRVILTTNMKSSSLMDELRFDYVIIDEAGHAHEPETLLPISCLKEDGCLVLAGDPKQLGPVVKCPTAVEYGLENSLLERVFKFSIYQRDHETNKYNNKYITKLLISYRCDPRILAISNKLFYDNELECANETPRSLLKMMRITNPLQFRFVSGQEEKPKFSTSRQNSTEANECVDLIVRLYKMGLTPNQIGVISPYKLQSKLIRKQLRERIVLLRDFYEKRFREVKFVERRKEKEGESNVDGPETNTMTLGLEKLGEDEEFDLGEQDKKVEENEEFEIEWVVRAKEREDNWMCKINSVDAFQGNEREVIIISTVRTQSTERTDFINEPRRFNVAISRAKWLVFVLGHKRVLELESNWSEFLSHAGEESSKWPQQSSFDPYLPFEQLSPLFNGTRSGTSLDHNLLDDLISPTPMLSVSQGDNPM